MHGAIHVSGPFLGAAHQTRTQWIPLDVPDDGQQMVVFLDRECLETPLPNMTAALVDFAIAANMDGQEPMHPTAQMAVMFGPKSQMKMVGHQAIGQHPHFDPSAGLPNKANEGVEISLAMKYFRA